ncbi:Hemagglutinin/hemolysin-related protein [Sandaracinus amylolyticus]|uniref:Hemagglutinin/hemolysin-related protein n=1 Tax=Sandaracinus amylolyticus TaxID=927083 RepID=A0A0F6VYV2_9BACT|nr:Hemagglutinin/hemolysin-related protein [Sandaracinus amylolyticus]
MIVRGVVAAIVALVTLSACTLRDDPALTDRDAGASDAARDAQFADAPFDAGFSCRPGVVACAGSVHYRCGDDGVSRVDETTCPEACDAELGCVTCAPGTRRCEGSASMACNDEGTGWTFGRDCADWGVACGEGGWCEDACATAEARRSYVGCEYFATPLPNWPDLEQHGFDFRIVVTNPEPMPVQVTIYRGTRLVERKLIVPGGFADIALPWIDDLSFPYDGTPWQSAVIEGGAYRIISTRPVIVAQFNPFHYVAGVEHSYSNDASLLLPVHALGTEYVGLSYPPISSTSDSWPGYLALVGTTPEPANVEITPRVDVAADEGGRWPATSAGTTIRFALARGEVATITSSVPPLCDATHPRHVEGLCYEAAHDLTGTRIVSDRPIEAFGAHVCAYVPFDTRACDHLETTLAPLGTWGSRFETMPLRDPETDVENLVRVVAGHDGTTLAIDPPQRGIDASLVLDAGEHVDFLLSEAVSIVSSRPVQIGQLLLGQHVRTPPLERGDPGLTILVPQQQFRDSYVFVTPTSYAPTVRGQSWVLVSREPGAEITLDGEVIDATWMRVGDRELAIVPVAGGAHRASASSTFGLVAYGLGEYTSYAYPAGLDLRVIPF